MSKVFQYPQGNKDSMSQDDFEVALNKVQLSIGSISKDMMKRRQLVEKQIESLQTEMEESLFFHELDGADEDDLESFDEKPVSYTFASFEYTAAALAKSQEANKKLTYEIKLSEKRSSIAQQKLALAELKEKDFQYRNASLEQMVSLYQQRLASLELKNKQMENENKSIREDRDRVSQKLHDTMNIVTESINHVESLEAKVEEKEVSLKLTQKLFSDASEEAKEAKNTIRSLQASLTTAETKLTVTKANHAAEVDNLRNELNNAQNENKSLNGSIKSLEVSAAQHVEELTNKVSDLESAKALALKTLEDSLNETRCKLTSSENSLESEKLSSQQLKALVKKLEEEVTNLRSELATNDKELQSCHQSIKEKDNLIADLQAVASKIDALEVSLESEKKDVEQLQDMVTYLEKENSTLRSETETNVEDLKLCQQLINEKDEAITELQSMLAYNDEELNSISAMFEEYKSMNEENILRALNKQEEDLESKEQQLQEIYKTLEKQREFMLDMEDLQKKQCIELEEARSSIQTKNAKLSNLQQELEASKQSLEHSKLRQKQLGEDLFNLGQTAEQLTVTVNSLKQKSSNQEADLIELNAVKEKLKEELLEKERKYDQLMREKEGIEKDLLSRHSIFEKEIKEKDCCLQQLVCEKQILEKDLLTSKSLFEDELRAKEGLFQQLELHKVTSNEDLKTRISILEENLLMKEDHVQQIVLEKEHYVKELSKINDHFQQLLSKKEALENDLMTTKSMLEVAHNELQSKGMTMDDMHIALSENFKTISSLRVDLDRTRLQLSLAEHSIDRIKAEFTDSFLSVDPRVTALQASLDEANVSLQEKNNQIQKLEEDLKRALLANEEALGNKNSQKQHIDNNLSDILTMKEELQKTKQAISMLITHRISHEESLDVLRKTLEEKSLEVETFKGMKHKSDDVSNNEPEHGLNLDGELIAASGDDAQSAILHSSLVEACELFSRKTLQLAQLDDELKKARAIESLLETKISHQEQQFAADLDEVEPLDNMSVASAKINKHHGMIIEGKNILWYKEDHELQVIKLESKIALLEKNISELQMMLDVASSKHEANKDYIEDLEVSLAAATKINEDFFEKHLGVLVSKIESAESLAQERELLLENTKYNHNAIVEQLEELLSAANKTNDELQNEVTKFQAERSSMEMDLGSCKTSLIEMEQKLDHEIAKHKETKDELLRASSIKENSSLFANREIQQLKNKLKDVESSRDKMKKAVETMIQRYSLLEKKLSEVEQDLNAKHEELEGLKEESERISVEKEDLEKYLENLKCKVEKTATFNKKDAMLHHYLDHLIKSFQKKEKEVAKLSALLDQKEIHLADLVRSSKENADIIKTLEALINDRDEELRHLNGSLLYLQKQMKALAKKYEYCASTLEDFKIHANELNLENSELNNELCLLKKEMVGKSSEAASSRTPNNRRMNYSMSSLSDKTQVFHLRTPSRNGSKAEKIHDNKSTSRTSKSEKAQETGSSRSRKSSDADVSGSPLSQARKNWEALKKEKAGEISNSHFTNITNYDKLSSTTNLQDDEFLQSRKVNAQSNIISP